MISTEALEFANSFDVGEYGIISNPGKFEAECRYVPYFWSLTLISAQDDTNSGYGDYVYFIFNVNKDDIKEFPELSDVKKVIIFEDTQGFVNSELE